MNGLEFEAVEKWRELGVNAPEIVALGVITELAQDGGVESVVWYKLENSAMAGEFYVTGEDLTAAVEVAYDELAGTPTYGMLLWHSHYISEIPSDADIEAFPEWLCEAGVVFHAPTQTTTLYSSGGVISTKPSLGSSLVDRQVSDGHA